MPEEETIEEAQLEATGKYGEITFRAFEGGKVFCICAMPGEELESKTFDLTDVSFLASLTEVISVTMIALALGMAPQVDA